MQRAIKIIEAYLKSVLRLRHIFSLLILIAYILTHGNSSHWIRIHSQFDWLEKKNPEFWKKSHYLGKLTSRSQQTGLHSSIMLIPRNPPLKDFLRKLFIPISLREVSPQDFKTLRNTWRLYDPKIAVTLTKSSRHEITIFYPAAFSLPSPWGCFDIVK